MTELVRFDTSDGGVAVVEVSEDLYGRQRVSRKDGTVIDAGRQLEDVLATANPVIHALVTALHGFGADEREIEFGLKLTAEAGVVVAKTAVEGHFTIKLGWHRREPPTTTAAVAAVAADAGAPPSP
jgi:hypothetical protein